MVLPSIIEKDGEVYLYHITVRHSDNGFDIAYFSLSNDELYLTENELCE